MPLLRGNRCTRDLPPGLKPLCHLLTVHSARAEVADKPLLPPGGIVKLTVIPKK